MRDRGATMLLNLQSSEERQEEKNKCHVWGIYKMYWNPEKWEMTSDWETWGKEYREGYIWVFSWEVGRRYSRKENPLPKPWKIPNIWIPWRKTSSWVPGCWLERQMEAAFGCSVWPAEREGHACTGAWFSALNWSATHIRGLLRVWVLSCGHYTATKMIMREKQNQVWV